MKTGLMTFMLLVCVSTALSAEPQAQVRGSDGNTAAILLDGLSWSETLRTLVDAIVQSDVVVYLEMQWNLWRRLAGSLAANTNVIDLQRFPNILMPECSA